MLKSLASAEMAIRLIQNVVKKSAARGFKLTKFIYNNSDVLALIPEKGRRVGIKNQDLLLGQLPEEKTLSVLWYMKRDSLGFKINLKEKPSTTRGLLATLSSEFDPLGLLTPILLTGKKINQDLCY